MGPRPPRGWLSSDLAFVHQISGYDGQLALVQQNCDLEPGGADGCGAVSVDEGLHTGFSDLGDETSRASHGRPLA